MTHRLGIFIGLFLFATLVLAEEDESFKVALKKFRLCQLSAVQWAGSSYSGEASWTPSVTLEKQWFLQGVIGLSLLSSGGLFPAFDIGPMVGFEYSPTISFLGGLGYQIWLSTPGLSGLTVGMGLLVHWDYLKDSWIKTLFFGYQVFLASIPASLIRIGVEWEVE